MSIANYFKSLATPNSGNSSKAFALLLSAIIGGLMGLSICFVLIYDIILDGKIDTNLNDLGWFLLCTGGYSFGAGAGKIITDSIITKKKTSATNNGEETVEP